LIDRKIFNNLEDLLPIIKQWKTEGKTIVFTNGCFDLVHPGHVRYLEQAKNINEKLIVGINSDESVQKLKGQNRPIIDLKARMTVLAA
jgi:D-beta-D-heptose 7-phosphate kinase/D-beta-D-heptose 1-phosphate adenosyltransferase